MKIVGGVSKKPKQQRKSKSKPTLFDEKSEDITQSDVRGDDVLFDEEDIAHTSDVPLKTSKSIAKTATPMVCTPPSSSILTPPESYVFEQVLNELFTNLSQTLVPLPSKTTFVPIQTNIPPLLKSISESTSQP